MRIPVALMLALALAGCASRSELKPKAGKELPVAPYGRDERLSSNALLEPPPQAAPERSVELRKRSEERADDPYDLPPTE